MKKILIVNHYATPPMYGGLSRHHYFAKYLKKKGYDVKILASSAIHNSTVNMIEKHEKILFKEKEIDGVDYIYVKTCSYKNKIKRIFNMLQFYVKAKKVAKKLDRYDVIYSSTPQPLSALLGLKIAKKTKAESIAEVRDLWPESMISYDVLKKNNIIVKILYMIEKKIYINSSKLVFTMQGGKDYLKERKYSNKINFDKVYHLNNGIDLKKYNNDLKKYKLKDKDLENENFKIIYTGSLRYIYNIEQLVLVAESLKDYKDIQFLIYGEGPFKESAVNLAKQKKLSNIKFKGFVDSKYIPYILSKGNVNLLHGKATDITKYGMSTNKSFMYLASGKPIISTYYGKYDLISKYNCGITLKDSNIQEYKQTILKFYNMNKKEYNKYCENCKTVAQEYDYEKLTEQLINIIEE